MARGDALPSRSKDRIAQVRRQADFVRMKVEKLTAERGDMERSMSAVRRSELQPLASITLSSTQITSTPTMEEYNSLQRDVAAIFDALQRISNILGTATIQKI